MLRSTESEHLTLTDHEIIFEEFQSMLSQSINVRDRQTDVRTDDMRSQDRALHCSVSRGKNVVYQTSLRHIDASKTAKIKKCNNSVLRPQPTRRTRWKLVANLIATFLGCQATDRSITIRLPISFQLHVVRLVGCGL